MEDYYEEEGEYTGDYEDDGLEGEYQEEDSEENAAGAQKSEVTVAESTINEVCSRPLPTPQCAPCFCPVCCHALPLCEYR